MRATKTLLSAATLLLGLTATACSSMVPFTHELRTASGLTGDEIKNLQFYTSSKMVFRREVESGGKQITEGHKLLITSGKVIEEVEVDAKTPGVAVALGSSTITVSFEPGASLDFVLSGDRFSHGSPPSSDFAQPPEPFPGNRAPSYPDRSSASEGTGNYWLGVMSNGQVTYQGKRFDVMDQSGDAYLMIDAESLNRIVKNRKVLKGIRLPHS
ncbi:MAG: DNA-directed RNA polymerase [Byssovorax sp.]